MITERTEKNSAIRDLPLSFHCFGNPTTVLAKVAIQTPVVLTTYFRRFTIGIVKQI
jgi:hypothetical protein